ncbi:ABC transporter ATP-binding protein [Paenibacillus macquariensis]|uniref:Iron(III) transport system ATP-binding protein n=1 Tax=Paenibacillus macquariensis TaxID=948756 RepID=A0ABY1K1H5_9BACL|nr:ATP-binding cassette domain-containing protein [Paenibacillus macquariensis]MEC0091757.1 ATP-binding cassette domain-containing protein [Paenibacillus macquariensis]OAB32321.1 amino acid ABC transporter substrate-binding protein [Paenibacillus macquariensis subsp. macquariensis]SIR12473.1 iron(III) transport system ATP-binding protein [Paenibacillus macquariensis]
MKQGYLSLRNLSKHFGKQTALQEINLDIYQHEFICLLGPSGCGKTTLLRILAGLEKADRGHLTIDGKDITSVPAGKRNFGMMFQSYALFPNLSVSENIAYGLRNRLTKSQIIDRVDELLSLVELDDQRHKVPAQLSGGQQQRVALARALAFSPDCLLLDEPLSALDAKVRVKLRREICRLHKQFGMTTIMVTHDQEEALTMADRIVVMNQSRIIQVGTPNEVYERPNSPFVTDFIGAVSFIETDDEKQGNPVLAIRPEHVQLVREGPVKGRQGIVREIEYRGTHYRLVLELLDHQGAPRLQFLTVDLPTQAMATLHIKLNQKVTFKLLSEHIIRFDTVSNTNIAVG